MKVLLPINTSHSISFIPRFYPTGVLSMDITKEGYDTLVTVTPSYSVNNGLINLDFDLTGVEQDRFSVKITEGSNTVFKGKLFFTSQNSQDFKLTKDTYIYV